MTQEALDQQIATGNDIRVLQENVMKMGQKLTQVQSLASNTLQDSRAAYDSALNIYRGAISLEVPEVDSENLKDQADKIKAEATRIAEEADRLIRDHDSLLRDSRDNRAKLEEDLLARAKSQKQSVDAQFDHMKANKERADKAVDEGNTVLKDAERTLRTLEDFENSVNENQVAADEAMQSYDSIEQKARAAFEKAMMAKEAMAGADVSANLALEVAINAQTISREALQKANKAQHKATDSSKKVIMAQKELQEISAILSTVEEPEPGLLEELARRVDEAEGKFRAADLDQKLMALEEAKQRQAEQVREMDSELKYMKDEVAGNKETADRMPTFCPKNNELCLENNC